jgi:hypothetical protein
VEDYINKAHGGENLEDELPRFPAFRFVHAGIAVVEGKSAYLLEEVIPNSRSEFVKYINNRESVPCSNLLAQHKEPAQALCFAQHVQYHMAHGLAFVSDFQGK